MINELSDARIKELEILYKAKEDMHEPLSNILLWASCYLEEASKRIEEYDARYAKRLRDNAAILEKAQRDMAPYLSKA